MFRGREVTHPERGTALLDRLASELSDIGVIEQSPLQDGRNMTMLLAPSKAVLAAGEKEQPEGNGQSGSRKRGERHADETVEGAPGSSSSDEAPASPEPARTAPASPAASDAAA
jgi:translation initiation factor IF-3